MLKRRPKAFRPFCQKCRHWHWSYEPCFSRGKSETKELQRCLFLLDV